MAREQGGEQAPELVAAEAAARGSRDLFISVPLLGGPGASESFTTVHRLRALEAKISASPAVAGAVLSLSAPDEPALQA